MLTAIVRPILDSKINNNNDQYWISNNKCHSGIHTKVVRCYKTMFKWIMIIIYAFRLPTHAIQQTQCIMLQYYDSKSKSLVVPKYV